MIAKCKVAKEKNDCWPDLLEEAKKKKLEKITFTADHNEGKKKQPEKKWQLFPFPT